MGTSGLRGAVFSGVAGRERAVGGESRVVTLPERMRIPPACDGNGGLPGLAGGDAAGGSAQRGAGDAGGDDLSAG